MFLTHRWTLDYKEDLDFILAVLDKLSYSNDFSYTDLLDLLVQFPELAEINKSRNGIRLV